MVLIVDGNSETGARVRMFFDLFKAFDEIESNHKLEFFLPTDLFSFAQLVLSYQLT